jgi:hypothetical protein
VKGSDNDFPSILLTEGTTPTSPAASHDRLFVRSSDHLLCLVNSSGTVTAVGGGGGSGITRTTLGTTSAGASFATRGMYIKKVTLSSAGLLASINAHLKGDGSGYNSLVGVVYSDSGGNPTNLICATSVSATSAGARNDSVKLNTTARWMGFPVGMWLAAADYWIGVWLAENSGSMAMLAYSSGTGSDRTTTGPAVTNTPVDSSVQAISTGTNDYSIYADILR